MQTFVSRFKALDRVPRLIPETAWINTCDKQENLLDMTVRSTIARQYPLPPTHAQELLESIVRTCENERLEISESVYELLSKTLGVKTEPSLSHYYGSYRIREKCDVVFTVASDQDNSMFVRDGSTGFCTWEAGKCLAWYLCTQIDGVDALGNILEIGCGTGITGIVISKICRNPYTFTDYHASTLEQAQSNASLNSVENANFRFLDMMKDVGIKADTIVGADILYDPDLCNGLVLLLSERSEFKQAYIMTTIRTEATYSNFMDALGRCGNLKWSVVIRQPMSEWIADANDPSWGNFLDSSTRYFDAEIELVRIVKIS
jgi:hypothetical protein